MKIEYLIIIKQKGAFCENREAFINFLKVDSTIKIKANRIVHTPNHNSVDTFSAEFDLATGKIDSKQERFFLLVLKALDDVEPEKFVALASTIKEIAKRINPESTRINTLWDDTGRQYAIAAYPLINEVENLMRKLISQFMLINVGMEWSKEAIRSELLGKIALKSIDEDTYLDDLFKVDFIDLSDVLFEKKRGIGLDEMDRLLSQKQLESVDLEKIRSFLPRSNWEKHFSSIVKYDPDKLKTKWKLLYELRNEVAHNRYIDREKFYKIRGLTRELKQLIEEAINNLGSIALTQDEKAQIIYDFQPGSMAARGYLAEKAVGDWYIQNFSVAEIRSEDDFGSRDHGYDIYVVFENSARIGVDVKLFQRMTTGIVLGRLKKYDIPHGISLIQQNKLDEFHICLVLADIESYEHIQASKSILELIAQMKAEAGNALQVVIGYLNSDNVLAASKIS